MQRTLDLETLALARETLKLAGIRVEEIESYPIDAGKIAKSRGIRWCCRRLPGPIRAMSDFDHRIIVLNMRRNSRQRRWDLLHVVYELITLDLGNLHDASANEFASHCLVPLESLKLKTENRETKLRFEELTGFYGVTEAVIIYQLKMLRYYGEPV